MTVVKLILILYSFNGTVSISEANIGDTWGNGGFYFTTMEKCQAVGKAWDNQGHYYNHVCLSTDARN